MLTNADTGKFYFIKYMLLLQFFYISVVSTNWTVQLSVEEICRSLYDWLIQSLSRRGIEYDGVIKHIDRVSYL